MVNNIIILIGLLLLCNACVSRTMTIKEDMHSSEKKLTSESKLIWFWQDEYRDN